MRILQLERGKGKTQEAIDTALAADAYLVVRHRAEADRVFRLAREQGKDIRYPITFDDFVRSNFGRHIHAFVIDNVDALLMHFARGAPVLLVTATIEVGHPRWRERPRAEWQRSPGNVDAEWVLLDDADRPMGEVYRYTFGPTPTWSFMLDQRHPAAAGEWPDDLHSEGDARDFEDACLKLAVAWARLGVHHVPHGVPGRTE